MQQRLNKIDESSFSLVCAQYARILGLLVSGMSLLVLFVFALTPLAHASQTTGTISSTYKYAWSDVGGYVNFAPTHSTISVTDTGLSGYVWSENDGWINLSPTKSGVTNNGNGTLGGFAWDPLKGWVSFTGVTIDSSGKFHGRAVGVSETISFDCAHCDVRTDWRPVSARTTSTQTPTTYGGGIINISSNKQVSATITTTSAQPSPRTTNSKGNNSKKLTGSSTSRNTNTLSGIYSASTTNGLTSTSALVNKTSALAAATTTSATLLSPRIAAYAGVAIILLLIILFAIRLLFS